MKSKILLLFSVGLFTLTLGCAYNRQYATTTTTNPTNGVVTVTMARSTTYAIGDAKTLVDSSRATSSVKGTSSVGAKGIQDEVNTGNFATNVNALGGLLQQLKGL